MDSSDPATRFASARLGMTLTRAFRDRKLLDRFAADQLAADREPRSEGDGQ